MTFSLQVFKMQYKQILLNLYIVHASLGQILELR